MMVITLVAKVIDAGTVGAPTPSSTDVWNGVLNSVYFVGGIAAIVVIVISGFLYVTSNGDASKIQKAKNAILYSVIGLIIIMSAFTLTQFIIGRAT